MKVILLEDIKGVGKKGDLLNASDGHARNYLLPRGLAVEANKKNMTELEQKQKSAENKMQKEYESAAELKSQIESKSVKIPIKIGGSGKLFGAITNKEVAAALEEQCGIKIDRKKVNITDRIKAAGEYTAEIKLHPKVTANLKFMIEEAKD